MQHQSILRFKHGRYLKLALVTCSAAIAAYVWYEPPLVYLKQYGGTPLGYVLGAVGALLIVWLMLLGVRKRRYRARFGSVQGWTSAHVYLGTSLFIIVTLHCGFEFGWNIHTLAYVLMAAAIVSGFFGIYAYQRYPALVTANLGNESPETLSLEIAELDRKCRRIALDLPDDINAVVVKATRARTRSRAEAGRLRLRPLGWLQNDSNSIACDRLQTLGRHLVGEQAKLNQQLLTELTRKKALTERLRRDLGYRALLELWLFFHVPLSFALLAALIAHVVSVFYFW